MGHLEISDHVEQLPMLPVTYVAYQCGEVQLSPEEQEFISRYFGTKSVITPDLPEKPDEPVVIEA